MPSKKNPLATLPTFKSEMNRLFDQFFEDGWATEPFRGWSGRDEGSFLPALDVSDETGGIRITAEIPGMTEKDVQVTLRGDVLVIHGEKKEEKEETSEGSYRSERRFGSFERHIRIPTGIDTAKATATCKDGILTVELPRTAEAKAGEKKIEIKNGNGKTQAPKAEMATAGASK